MVQKGYGLHQGWWELQKRLCDVISSYSDLFPTEEFGKYCDDIVNTAAWGGQLEVSWITVTVD